MEMNIFKHDDWYMKLHQNEHGYYVIYYHMKHVRREYMTMTVNHPIRALRLARLTIDAGIV